ncbi:hypothetical protein [Aeromonas caviae]|uniref:hypothetical protein n=1 Tax=Aeromonas caviae TaxID=648 RepID=UPI002E22310E
MSKRLGLTEEQSANSFTDEELAMMAYGNNPQTNAMRELLASRQSLLDYTLRVQQLLEERNRTGLAVDAAILSGIVPEQHSMRSRLEMLANHRKREQEMAAQLDAALRTIGRLCYLLGSTIDCMELDMVIEDMRPQARDEYLRWRDAVHLCADRHRDNIIHELPGEYLSSDEAVGLPPRNDNEVAV